MTLIRSFPNAKVNCSIFVERYVCLISPLYSQGGSLVHLVIHWLGTHQREGSSASGICHLLQKLVHQYQARLKTTYYLAKLWWGTFTNQSSNLCFCFLDRLVVHTKENSDRTNQTNKKKRKKKTKFLDDVIDLVTWISLKMNSGYLNVSHVTKVMRIISCVLLLGSYHLSNFQLHTLYGSRDTKERYTPTIRTIYVIRAFQVLKNVTALMSKGRKDVLMFSENSK